MKRTLTALLTGTALVTTAAAAAAVDGPSVTSVLSGLTSPRGLAFDGQGSLYLAESGTAAGALSGFARTGWVSKDADPGLDKVWSARFTRCTTASTGPLRRWARKASVPSATAAWAAATASATTARSA